LTLPTSNSDDDTCASASTAMPPRHRNIATVRFMPFPSLEPAARLTVRIGALRFRMIFVRLNDITRRSAHARCVRLRDVLAFSLALRSRRRASPHDPRRGSALDVTLRPGGAFVRYSTEVRGCNIGSG
jgi:hypothetical protein